MFYLCVLSISISIKHRNKSINTLIKIMRFVTLNYFKTGAEWTNKLISMALITCFRFEHLYHLCMFASFALLSCGLNSSRKVLDLEMDKNAFICARSESWSQGWRYSQFFFIRKLGLSIYHSSPKNIKNIKHPKRIFEILASPQNINHSVH